MGPSSLQHSDSLSNGVCRPYSVKRSMASPACWMSASKTRCSGCIDKFAGFVDGGSEVRVPFDGSGFDEVDAKSAQGRFQGFGEVEKLIEGR